MTVFDYLEMAVEFVVAHAVVVPAVVVAILLFAAALVPVARRELRVEAAQRAERKAAQR